MCYFSTGLIPSCTNLLDLKEPYKRKHRPTYNICFGHPSLIFKAAFNNYIMYKEYFCLLLLCLFLIAWHLGLQRNPFHIHKKKNTNFLLDCLTTMLPISFHSSSTPSFSLHGFYSCIFASKLIILQKSTQTMKSIFYHKSVDSIIHITAWGYKKIASVIYEKWHLLIAFK